MRRELAYDEPVSCWFMYSGDGYAFTPGGPQGPPKDCMWVTVAPELQHVAKRAFAKLKVSP